MVYGLQGVPPGIGCWDNEASEGRVVWVERFVGSRVDGARGREGCIRWSVAELRVWDRGIESGRIEGEVGEMKICSQSTRIPERGGCELEGVSCWSQGLE